mmetsp:Transcript_30448/g.97142  ORF Transcript_30448/g.97142 Transcript_30448/m.97142 type:complete len:423 (-) Transcript_30448:1167-2435(-)
MRGRCGFALVGLVVLSSLFGSGQGERGAWRAAAARRSAWGRVRGGSVGAAPVDAAPAQRAALRKILVATPALSKQHLDRKSEVQVPENATVGELKDAIAARFPGGPPRSLLRVFSGGRELADDAAPLPEELLEVRRPTVLVDLVLTTSGREASRQVFQSVDRLSSAEERIEAYAATYSALKFYLDAFEAEDVRAALDAKACGPDGEPVAAAEEVDEEEDAPKAAKAKEESAEEGEGKDFDEDEDEELEDAPEPAYRVNDLLRRMGAMRGFLEAQLRAHREEEERLAPGREARAREERIEAEALAALMRQGTLTGRVKLALAINFNANWQSWGGMMLGMFVMLRCGAVAPHMRPLMYTFMALLVGFQTRPVRLASKVAMNLMPPSLVTLAGSFLSVPQTLVLTHDPRRVLEDLYGKAALEKFA